MSVASTIDLGGVQERAALSLEHSDGPPEVKRYADHEAGRLVAVSTVPKARMKPCIHGVERGGGVFGQPFASTEVSRFDAIDVVVSSKQAYAALTRLTYDRGRALRRLTRCPSRDLETGHIAESG